MAQNYKIPHRIKTKAIKKLQKPTILMNFVHFMHESNGYCNVSSWKMDSLKATHPTIIHALVLPLAAHKESCIISFYPQEYRPL